MIPNPSKKPTIHLILFFVLVPLFLAPAQEDNSILFKDKDFTFPYDLLSPNQVEKLAGKLEEISGISYIDDKRFACVQDEKGNIYIVNFTTAEIEKKINFADDGDFEGIALVGNTAWVLKSSGDLYQVENFIITDEAQSIKHENALSNKNNTEGLAFDQDNNRLLIACKGYPFIDDGEKSKNIRTIYEFNLDTKSLNPTPVFIIDLDQIKESRDYNTMTKLGIKLLSKIDRHRGDVSFQPSDLAIHPKTKNIYVIGSVGDLLIVLNPDGKILAMIDLADKLFRQPEGICFTPDGTLYISNEGDGKKATILEFKTKSMGD